MQHGMMVKCLQRMKFRHNICTTLFGVYPDYSPPLTWARFRLNFWYSFGHKYFEFVWFFCIWVHATVKWTVCITSTNCHITSLTVVSRNSHESTTLHSSSLVSVVCRVCGIQLLAATKLDTYVQIPYGSLEPSEKRTSVEVPIVSGCFKHLLKVSDSIPYRSKKKSSYLPLQCQRGDHPS